LQHYRVTYRSIEPAAIEDLSTMKSFFNNTGLFLTFAAITMQATISYAFITPQAATLWSLNACTRKFSNDYCSPLFMAETEAENQVVELADDETEEQASESKTDDATAVSVAPFLSQGEISEEALTMDWNDPKQQRVMFYIILSLLPVLFLIPLMLGSRELLPPDLLPPIEL
jgi:hypothetical protein